MAPPPYDVFLSYSSRDEDLAILTQQISGILEGHGYSVFLDALEIIGGDDVITSIFDTIGRCRYFAVFLTPNSVASRWVTEELAAATARHLLGEMVILPLLYEDCAIPGFLLAKHYIDFRESVESGGRELIAAIARHDKRSSTDLGPHGDEGQPTLGDRTSGLAEALEATDVLYLAVDIGGTKVYVSLMNRHASRMFDRKFHTEGHNRPTEFFAFVRNCILVTMDGICDMWGHSHQELERRITAIGLGFPGLVDFEAGVVSRAPNLGIVEPYPLAARLSEAFSVPTFVDNDVNLGVLGETWKGATRECRNVVGIIIGTGIGGGVIIDGALYRGVNKAAGEIGHIVVDVAPPDQRVTPECSCGQHGCFEAFASRKSIARSVRERKSLRAHDSEIWSLTSLGSNELAFHYRNGDPDVVEVVDEAARVCGKVAFSMLNVFNPEAIVFSGGFVLRLGEEFLAAARSEVQKCMDAIRMNLSPPDLVRIGSLDNAILVGACRMLNEATASPTVEGVETIVRALSEDLTDSDLQLLRDIGGAGNRVPISKDPRSVLRSERLRPLRNRGLICTESGESLAKSQQVEITEFGRLVLDHIHDRHSR